MKSALQVPQIIDSASALSWPTIAGAVRQGAIGRGATGDA
jgi:hypothetical protein